MRGEVIEHGIPGAGRASRKLYKINKYNHNGKSEEALRQTENRQGFIITQAFSFQSPLGFVHHHKMFYGMFI